MLPLIGSPESLLASFFSTDEPSHRSILLTGRRGCGKTSWCMEFASLAKARGLRLAGLISPAVFSSKGKTSIDLLDVSSGQRRCLAFLRSASLADERTDSGAIYAGQWQFDPLTLAWGNEIVGRLGETDLFLLDELGPLEFLQNTGLVSALRRLDASQDRLAVAVVRPELLERALQRWPWADAVSTGLERGQADWRPV